MRLLGVEAARGVAALLVVMFHAAHILGGPKDYGQQAFGGLMQFGRAGVDFFFVLSGFIITYVHLKDVGQTAKFVGFWRKRLLRIYPTYWAALALWGLLLACSPTPGRSEQNLLYIVNSVLLLPETGREPILAVAWSLQHEMIFYALFSLVILSRRIGLAALAAWFALIAFDIGWVTATGVPFFSGFTEDFIARVFNIQFLFGIAVALLLNAGPASRPRTLLVFGAGLFLLTGLFESFGPSVQHEWPPLHLTYALASGMALYGLATLDQASSLKLPGVMIELGTSSYSIYLVHVFFLLLAQQAIRYARPFLGLPLELAYLLAVAFAVLGGVLFSRAVERPLLRAGRKVLRPKPRLARIEPHLG